MDSYFCDIASMGPFSARKRLKKLKREMCVKNDRKKPFEVLVLYPKIKGLHEFDRNVVSSLREK